MTLVSLLSTVAAVAFPTGGALGIARNFLDVILQRSPRSGPDPISLLDAQTRNVIAETELVKARSGAFVQEEGTMFHYVAPPDMAPVPGEFNAMKWTRLLFSIVAIGLFASIGAVYVHSAASSGVVDQSAAEIGRAHV